jgi:predicted secreted hydrolase
MLRRLLAFTLIAALAIAGFWYVTRRPIESSARPPITSGLVDTSGFARALQPIEFTFPQDHGPHFEYQTEWWYYTGNVQAKNGEHFGYQLTFFRRGLTPGAPPDNVGLATNQIYFAHFALTDVAGGQHRGVERFSRGAGELAGASGTPFRAWLEDWRAEALNADGSAVRLSAQDGGLALDLKLRTLKSVVAHGERGLSAKSDEPGNASYYLSFTRMATEGAVTVNGQTFEVNGESWFDHEWSTSVLGPHAVGWDWYSLQLSDGREVMLYSLRRDDGTFETASGGTLVQPDGRTQAFRADAAQVTATGTWTSPVTNVVYPSGWTFRLPSAQLELNIEPWIKAQEMQLNFSYWEGAVRVSGTSGGRPITGNGYVELTGYSSTMQGVLGSEQ